MQTDLNSDAYCSFNQETSSFYYIFQPNQYRDTFQLGEVGVNVQGGAAGSYIRPEVIDVSSFLSGREDVLSKCNPPIPSLATINQPTMYVQGQSANGSTLSPGSYSGPVKTQTQTQTQTQTEHFTNDTTNPDPKVLVPLYTKEKHSATELSSIDYNRWQPSLFFNPQTPRYVIEDFAAQRGGLNTTNYIKSAWNNQNQVENFDKNACMTTLDPSRDCGPDCSLITGYPGVSPLDGSVKNVVYKAPGLPPGLPPYPFPGITSQQIVGVGADSCGPTFFNGVNFDKGSCPPSNQTMLTRNNRQIPLLTSLGFKN